MRTLGSGEGMLRSPFEPPAILSARPALQVVVRIVADHLHRAVRPPSEAERYGQAAAVAPHQRHHGHAPRRSGRLVDDLAAR